MQVISLLLPDFILILMGVIIFRITNWGEAFWAGMEKMVYYLLFPALLFYSTARLQLNLATTGKFVEVGVLALLAGVNVDRTKIIIFAVHGVCGRCAA